LDRLTVKNTAANKVKRASDNKTTFSFKEKSRQYFLEKADITIEFSNYRAQLILF